MRRLASKRKLPERRLTLAAKRHYSAEGRDKDPGNADKSTVDGLAARLGCDDDGEVLEIGWVLSDELCGLLFHKRARHGVVELLQHGCDAAPPAVSKRGRVQHEAVAAKVREEKARCSVAPQNRLGFEAGHLAPDLLLHTASRSATRRVQHDSMACTSGGFGATDWALTCSQGPSALPCARRRS